MSFFLPQEGCQQRAVDFSYKEIMNFTQELGKSKITIHLVGCK